jgi:hypothetical protein
LTKFFARLTGNVLSMRTQRIDKTLPVKRAKAIVNPHQNLNLLAKAGSQTRAKVATLVNLINSNPRLAGTS